MNVRVKPPGCQEINRSLISHILDSFALDVDEGRVAEGRSKGRNPELQNAVQSSESAQIKTRRPSSTLDFELQFCIFLFEF
jgi:hypothetical protein